VTATALATGCGGDVGGFADNGGMSGTGVTSGPVTGFGSIFVTDVEWSLGGAQIEIDDGPGTEAQLQLGMVVRVRGGLAPGATIGDATSVIADDSIEGPIDSTPTQTSASGVESLEFTVFGFPIQAERGATVFDDGATFDGLMTGDFVEVYGLPDDTGTIVATRIELKGTLSGGTREVELKGPVSLLATGSNTFEIGGIEIEYDDTTTVFRDGLSSEGDLANGLVVEVKGTWLAADRVRAGVIEREDGVFGGNDGEEAKLRGFVANLSGSRFTISGVPVDASSATFDPTNLVLANRDYVEVEGRFSSGTLVAREVELEDLDDRDGDAVEIQARVPAGGVAAFGPDTLGMLVANPGAANGGIQVQVNPATRYDDQRDDDPGFGIGAVQEGDWLEIRAVAVDAANGIVVATRIERDDPEDDVILQGPVTDPSSTGFAILGFPIVEAASPEYRDLMEQSVSRAAFFGAITTGDIVKVEDDDAVDESLLGPADELEIEDYAP
jgi:hypothetical protein